MTTDEPKPTPRLSTAHSRELGEELRRARRAARRSSADTAETLGWSLGKLSKLETGTRGTVPWEIGTLLGHYGTDKTTRERVMAIATEPSTGSHLRLHANHGDIPLIVSMHERTALTITTYDGLTIPRPARTAEYTKALTGNATTDHSGVPRPGLTLTVYLAETTLRLPVGSPRTMHRQLLHLTHLCDQPDTVLRVVPLNAAAGSTLRHSTTLLTFAPPVRPMVCAETDIATVIHDSALALNAYETKFRQLDELALDTNASRSRLGGYIDFYDRRAA